MPKHNKTPKIKSSPPAKGPRAGGNPDDANAQTPVWSVSAFDHAGPWGRCTCERDAALWEEILPKLRNYETMTWNEIYQNKKRDHAVPIDGLCKDARDRLGVLNLDELDELFRFRLAGKMRVWGFRVGRVFSLLWFDPEHEIWPTEPK